VPRRESPTSKRRAVHTERSREALDLRLVGKTYDQIGEALGVSKQQAHRLVKAELDELAALTRGAAEELRQRELETLDRLLATAMPCAEQGDMQAADRVIKISARRSALLGLDAPAKHEHEVTVTTLASDLDAAQARIAADRK
jgi:hypothetical protein